MSKLKRRIIIVFVIAIVALTFVAKPYASEISPSSFGDEIGRALYNEIVGNTEEGK